MKKKKKKIYWYFILCLLTVLIVFPISIFKMNDALLYSGQIMGGEVAKRYATREKGYIETYEYVVNYIESALRPGKNVGNISKFMKSYLDFIDNTMKVHNVELYGVIDGKIVAATPWEGDINYDATKTEWYQGAMKSGDEIYYTDVYMDARLQEKTVTMAKRVQGTNNVIAMDIYANHFEQEEAFDMPNSSFYYLSDSKGVLLDWYVDKDISEEKIQKSYDKVFEEIKQGIHDDYDSSTVGVDGKKRGVYYYELDNGWYSVVTITYEELLRPTQTSKEIFFYMLVFLLFILAISLIVEYKSNKKAKLYNDIVGVLGNSYYALYMIELGKNEYMMLKSSDRIRKKLPHTGKYDDLLDEIKKLVDENTRNEFVESFSLENMKQLVKNRVHNFGGEFKRTFNNEYRWMQVQIIYDESLKADCVVLGFKDIDEYKKQEMAKLELLQSSLDSVDKMARSKNTFFSNMSHDMRTPLNGIIGLSKLALKNIDDPEKNKSTFEKILNLGNQLLNLINEILEISKMEQGKLEIQTEKFNLKQNVEELTSVFKMQTEGTKKQFLVDIDIEDEWVISDWQRLQQIFNNLLSNAFKFTKEDGEIKLSLRETKDKNSKYGKYQIIVKDNGTGMSKEFLEKLFIPFERETKFGAHNVSGTGLGMPIVHDLVIRMDGTIEVSSELGKGSTFEIVLPFEISEDIPKENEKEKQVDENELCIEGKKVILAEDNEINMEIATEFLKMCGFEVTQAWNGKEALDCFEQSKEGEYALIIMDMRMPVMDGCEATSHIRKLKRKDAATIPIIAATANAFSEDIALTKKAGMNAHISKPIDFEFLKKTIKELL